MIIKTSLKIKNKLFHRFDSAAHCVQQKNSETVLEPDNVLVLIGRHDLEAKIEKGAIQRDVDEIFLHPDWKAFNEKYDADLAIFVLNDIVEFSNYIRPVCLPDDGDVVADSRGKVVGWGLSEANKGLHESTPREASTKALNDSFCYTTSPSLSRFSSTRIFCGGPDNFQDGSPDSGDSGGGFFVLVGNSWVQYGIISASLTDARGRAIPNKFTLYTNIVFFKDWISIVLEKSGTKILTKSSLSVPQKPVEVWCNYEIVLTTM